MQYQNTCAGQMREEGVEGGLLLHVYWQGLFELYHSVVEQQGVI